jgi:adenosylcobinamide-GDP ribazoletransferase
MKPLLLAFQFLTIIPTRVRGEVTERDISQSASFFPLVGAFQGLIAVVMVSYLGKAFPPEITSALIILAWVLTNGGFHLDGLADTFDALAVKSTGDEGLDRERRLAVMKDSSSGAVGVTAIVFAVLLKFLFLSLIISRSAPYTCFTLLFLMPIFSNWAMVPSLFHGISARPDGLGKLFIDSAGRNTIVLASLLVILFFLLSSSIYLYKAYGTRTITLFFSLSITLYLFSLLSVWFCRRRFGGLTGDNFGAIHEISEILFLFTVTRWLQHSI